MLSLRYRGWGDGIARIPSFSFSGYFVAVFVGLLAGTVTFLTLAALSARSDGYVASVRQLTTAALETVTFSVAFSVVAVGPVALAGSIVLVPAIVWATKAGVRSIWATALAGAAAIGMLMLFPTLLVGFGSGSLASIIVPFAFMPAGVIAALSYRTVVLFRFGEQRRRM